ncbi:MAG: nucleotidyltransferase [Bacilli bacterium]|nr:nucleotidyltransferase [Bacilli bacterium]
MNKDITLVILAAGMGSRFGGLKQITPLGPNDEFIIDYSVFDAIKAGFTKIVFLIKEENYDIFKETIGARVEPHIPVEYCFQKNDNLPAGYSIPADRVKPLGTAHAILCCEDKVHEPFMIINADDFYGRDAFVKGANFLKNIKDEKPYPYGLVGYLVKNTITENGKVKRGVCHIDDGKLTEIVESSIGREEDNTIKATPLDETLPEFVVAEDDTVSMNMLCFTPSIFDYIKDHFGEFLDNNQDNLEKCEYLIPDVLFQAIRENFATCEVISTTATWYGVTYKEDADGVKSALKGLVDSGEYPNHLWDE